MFSKTNVLLLLRSRRWAAPYLFVSDYWCGKVRQSFSFKKHCSSELPMSLGTENVLIISTYRAAVTGDVEYGQCEGLFVQCYHQNCFVSLSTCRNVHTYCSFWPVRRRRKPWVVCKRLVPSRFTTDIVPGVQPPDKGKGDIQVPGVRLYLPAFGLPHPWKWIDHLASFED